MVEIACLCEAIIDGCTSGFSFKIIDSLIYFTSMIIVVVVRLYQSKSYRTSSFPIIIVFIMFAMDIFHFLVDGC